MVFPATATPVLWKEATSVGHRLIRSATSDLLRLVHFASGYTLAAVGRSINRLEHAPGMVTNSGMNDPNTCRKVRGAHSLNPFAPFLVTAIPTPILTFNSSSRYRSPVIARLRVQ